MDYVFKNTSRVPTIEQLVMTEFFRNIDLREMRATSWPVSCLFFLFKYELYNKIFKFKNYFKILYSMHLCTIATTG